MTTNIDDTTLLPAHVEQLTKAAENLGRDHGANAAEWYAQDAFGGRCTRDHKANAARVLEMIEDGDPELWDSINLPNLSGEYSGDLTPRTLAEDLCHQCRIDHDNVAPEVEDDLCQAYEDGVSTGFVDRLSEMARSVTNED
jgi:hypothetical protein